MRELRQGLRGEEVPLEAPEVRVHKPGDKVHLRPVPVREPVQVACRSSQQETRSAVRIRSILRRPLDLVTVPVASQAHVIETSVRT